jgi:hypothetical protein
MALRTFFASAYLAMIAAVSVANETRGAAPADLLDNDVGRIILVQSARLKGSAAMDALKGNTIVGQIDGTDHVMFFSADGGLKMVVDGDLAEGKWKHSGDQLCLVFEGEDDECYRLEVEAGKAFLLDSENQGSSLAIETGNSKKL